MCDQGGGTRCDSSLRPKPSSEISEKKSSLRAETSSEVFELKSSLRVKTSSQIFEQKSSLRVETSSAILIIYYQLLVLKYNHSLETSLRYKTRSLSLWKPCSQEHSQIQLLHASTFHQEVNLATTGFKPTLVLVVVNTVI